MKKFFIINPKAGKGRGQKEVRAIVKKIFPDAVVKFTEYKNHAKELAAEAVEKGFNHVIVAGGDGTINEAVQSLAETGVTLGVIPCGSGNGLAREFGMPLDNFELACKTISTAKEIVCDLGKANDDYFINLAGMGIEANIAQKFDMQGKTGKRGKLPYFEIGAKEVFNYRPPKIKLIADGKTSTVYPLTIVFTNGRQYGSNFKIAPQASFTDGFLDMVLITETNILRLLAGLPNFFIDGISPVKVTKSSKIEKAEIKLKGPIIYHIDGEPKETEDSLKISVCKGAIKVLMA